MTPEKIVENHKKYVLQSWSKQGNLNPIPVAKADGIYFYDFDGNRYTDMSSQLVNLNLGYGNKAIGVKLPPMPWYAPAFSSSSRMCSLLNYSLKDSGYDRSSKSYKSFRRQDRTR